MITNRVENKDFLNNDTIIKDDDYVFIKSMPPRNNLYYIQYKKFKDKIKNYNHIDPNNVENQDNKIIFEIFTLDEDKYNEKCNSYTQNPFSIDEVAKYKGFYKLKTKIKGIYDNTIDTSRVNVYVKFNSGIVSDISIVNTFIGRQKQRIKNDNLIENGFGLENIFDNTFDIILINFIKDSDDPIPKKLSDIIKVINPRYPNDQTDNKDVYNEIVNILAASEETDKEKYNKIQKHLKEKLPHVLTKQGGKATRRRKRKSKKRSKHTRKKRKSKKQRRQ